jgi:hypothetical protein
VDPGGLGIPGQREVVSRLPADADPLALEGQQALDALHVAVEEEGPAAPLGGELARQLRR